LARFLSKFFFHGYNNTLSYYIQRWRCSCKFKAFMVGSFVLCNLFLFCYPITCVMGSNFNSCPMTWKVNAEVVVKILRVLRPILNFTPRAKPWPPGAGEVVTQGIICVKLSPKGKNLSLPLHSSKQYIEWSPLGVNISPRGQSSPLGANFTPGGKPCY
jgi:hypothetical protein